MGLAAKAVTRGGQQGQHNRLTGAALLIRGKALTKAGPAR